ncbi:MAG: helix-turn-helix domain-containing protein [Pedococcus sp.]
MDESVKTRAYHSNVRAVRAEQTRHAVLVAARDLFVQLGYDATTVTMVADRAGVAVDTVYASVGRKPQLAAAVVDMVLGASEEPVTAEERDYVKAIRAADGARRKIDLYAAAVGDVVPRTAALLGALRRAGEVDEECARSWSAVVERRAQNMLLFAADLRATGELRDDLTDREVADLVWSTNSPEYWQLLQSRGWSQQRYAQLLADLWHRLLLAP